MVPGDWIPAFAGMSGFRDLVSPVGRGSAASASRHEHSVPDPGSVITGLFKERS